MEDKCFCHLNGYKVKDAEARKRLSGELPMGNITVSGIKGKNLFNIGKYKELGTTVIQNGVNITYNNDGTVLFNGQCSQELWLDIGDIILGPGTYTFSGCAKGGSASTYLMRLYFNDTSYRDIGEGVTFTISETIEIIHIHIYSYKDYIFDNVIFKPMIEKDGIRTEYAPYFELATKEDLENIEIDSSGGVENIYHLELPLGLIVQGQDMIYSNELSLECQQLITAFFNDVIVKDNPTNPILIIHNTSESVEVDGVTINNPSPRMLVLRNDSIIEPGDGFGIYSFKGHDVHDDRLYLDTHVESCNHYQLTVNYNIEDNSFVIATCYLASSSYNLVTEEYIKDNSFDLMGSPVFKIKYGSNSYPNPLPNLYTFNGSFPVDQANILTYAYKNGIQYPLFHVEFPAPLTNISGIGVAQSDITLHKSPLIIKGVSMYDPNITFEINIVYSFSDGVFTIAAPLKVSTTITRNGVSPYKLTLDASTVWGASTEVSLSESEVALVNTMINSFGTKMANFKPLHLICGDNQHQYILTLDDYSLDYEGITTYNYRCTKSKKLINGEQTLQIENIELTIKGTWSGTTFTSTSVMLTNVSAQI